MNPNNRINPLTDLSFVSSNLSDLVESLGKLKSLTTIATPNPEQIVLAKRQPKFGQALSKFDFLIPDGIGLIWASKLLALRGKMKPLAGRISGVELAEELIKKAIANQQKVLIVGGLNYQDQLLKLSNQTVKIIQADSHHLAKQNASVIYWAQGSADVAHFSLQEIDQVKQVIMQLKPDLVLVAMGAPYQEEWILNHQEFLNQKQVKIALTVGGAIDILIGRIQRSPQWMQDFGLEWLWRLIQEPWRWRRQLKLVEFAGLVFREVCE